jgi:hypothetical protein
MKNPASIWAVNFQAHLFFVRSLASLFLGICYIIIQVSVLSSGKQKNNTIYYGELKLFIIFVKTSLSNNYGRYEYK